MLHRRLTTLMCTGVVCKNTPILRYSPDTLGQHFFQSGLPDCRTSVQLNRPVLSAHHAVSMALRAIVINCLLLICNGGNGALLVAVSLEKWIVRRMLETL